MSADSVSLNPSCTHGPTTASGAGGWLVCVSNSGAAAGARTREVLHADLYHGHGRVPGPSGSAPAAFTLASSTTFTLHTVAWVADAGDHRVRDTAGRCHLQRGSPVGYADRVGTFPVTFTATNGVEAGAKQSFTLTVAASIPTTARPPVERRW